VLGDSGNDQSFIRTLHKRGFRFVGDVDEAGSAPAASAGDQPPSTPAAAHEAAKLGVPSSNLGAPTNEIRPF
jgi:adenylate cyclase